MGPHTRSPTFSIELEEPRDTTTPEKSQPEIESGLPRNEMWKWSVGFWGLAVIQSSTYTRRIIDLYEHIFWLRRRHRSVDYARLALLSPSAFADEQMKPDSRVLGSRALSCSWEYWSC